MPIDLSGRGTEDTLTQILGDFHRRWGYAAGMEKIPGFIPGAKSFPPYQEQLTFPGSVLDISTVDTYFGKRESGGLTVVSLDNKPLLLIQYHGGETPKVKDEEVEEINAFLKKALANSVGARLPNQGGPRVFYEDARYGYAGYSIGRVRDLVWVEIIYRKDGKHDIRFLTEGPTGKQKFEDIIIHGLRGGGQDWIVFYHVLTHQWLS